MKSVNNLKKITRALEVVSTVKLQRLKDQADSLKTYLVDLMTVISTVGETHSLFSNWSGSNAQKNLVIVVTSERWLCGGLNAKLLRTMWSQTHDQTCEYFVIGKKWLEFLKRAGASVVWSVQLGDRFHEESLLPLFAFYDEAVRAWTYARISLYFNYFKNSISQIPTSIEMFPFRRSSLDRFLKDIDVSLDTPTLWTKEILIEPDTDTYIHEIRRQIRNYIIASAVIQNKTWEHASRMIAMKNAKDNAIDIWKSLKRTFNKARQWAITQEISEIVSAKIAIEG